MDRIDIAPDGPLTIGTLTDDEGDDFVSIDLSDGETGQDYRVYFLLEHFVAFADHLRSVADELVEAKRRASH